MIKQPLRQRIPPYWQEWWDERVAIMHCDGELSLEQAQEEATECLRTYITTHVPLDYSREGMVYIIHAEGTPSYKIGRSWSPVNRRKQLQADTPQRLRILREIYHYDCMMLERMLHQRYVQYRRQGEWFDLPASVLQTLLGENFSHNR